MIEGVSLKRLIVLSSFILLSGCFGFGGPNEQVVLDIYREMHQPAESIEKLDCSKVGYGLPSEKEWPIYECTVGLKFPQGIGYDNATFIYQDEWKLQASEVIEKQRAAGVFGKL